MSPTTTQAPMSRIQSSSSTAALELTQTQTVLSHGETIVNNSVVSFPHPPRRVYPHFSKTMNSLSQFRCAILDFWTIFNVDWHILKANISSGTCWVLRYSRVFVLWIWYQLPSRPHGRHKYITFPKGSECLFSLDWPVCSHNFCRTIYPSTSFGESVRKLITFDVQHN